MLRTEGIRSFYKGAAVNALFTPPARALYMGGLELSKSCVGSGTAGRDFLAGTLAQLVGSLAYVPRDVIVERCAIDGQLKSQVGSCSSSIEALRTMWVHEGMGGFYRAYMPHQFVWIPYNGLFFALLGRLEAAEVEAGVSSGSDGASFGLGVVNSGFCAALAGWATTPLDVIKTRVQVQGANPELFAFDGPIDCVRQLVRKEGFAALFSGAMGRMCYLAPNMAIFVPLYEQLKRLASKV
uniref:Mitochondrial carrier protein n=1 Tax=Alexandrium andersonii TaxID=327968 RepID=A0A7S2HHE8_9DINO|mmetsp:Transcript_71543/g.160204  ORF Transcript_71543/g.160204 Transcript_71543/m.160204 type:complete len:239 (+) Transcript_71543:3-719(+)